MDKASNAKKKCIKNKFLFFARAWFESKNSTDIRSKIKGITLALILGIILAFLVLLITTRQNPFLVFGTMMHTAFNNSTFDYTLALVALLITSGIANAVAFKTGLFNIGVSGQMFFSGSIGVVLGLKVFNKNGDLGGDHIVMGLVIIIWLSALIGGLVAGFAGYLKARFNVHEVVTTILLNWALFYLARYIIDLIPNIIGVNGATKTLSPEFQISSSHYGLILFLASIVIALIISVILWKTTLGYSMKATGLSNTGSKYAGINIEKQVIIAMFISGIIAGLLGVMSFVITNRQVGTQYLSLAQLPTIGFNGIAIALLGFSNPLAIIPVAFFFGVFQSGAGGLTHYGIDNSFSNLIIGIIMYFAAISLLFIRFKPIEMIYVWIKIRKKISSKKYQEIFAIYQNTKAEYKNIPNKEIVFKKEALIKFKNIKKYKKNQIKLLKLEQTQEFNNYMRFYNNIQTSAEFRKIYEKYRKNLSNIKKNLNSSKTKKNKKLYMKQKKSIKLKFHNEIIKLQQKHINKGGK